MEHELFSSLLQNLLHLKTTSFREECGELREFALKYCYSAALQPMLTEEGLSAAVSGMNDHMIYELQCPLGIRIQLLRIDGRICLIGPFVTESFNERRIQNVLILHRLPASFAISIRLYYNAFPIVSSLAIISCVNAFLHSLFHVKEDYAYCRLTDLDAMPPSTVSQEQKIFDYNTIYQRYEKENRFLRLIEAGDTENVLAAYDTMSESGLTAKRYFNAIYHDVNISFAMVRALARKAAERGGASLLEIDEITQRAIQNHLSARNIMETNAALHSMIHELTEAVRRHRLYEGNYSPSIRKAAEYIRLNFSHELSLDSIADRVGLSAPYLSRQFKKEVGMAPSQYIQHLRCQQAAEMLKENDSSIADISAYVGYLDGNYFVKIFKKQYGMTPSEYRAKGK